MCACLWIALVFHFIPFLPYVVIYPTITLGQSSYNNHYDMTIGILTKICQNPGGGFWMRFQKMVLKVGIALPTHNNVNYFTLHHSIAPSLHCSNPHHLHHSSPSFTILLATYFNSPLDNLLPICYTITMKECVRFATVPIHPHFSPLFCPPFAKFGYILGVT